MAQGEEYANYTGSGFIKRPASLKQWEEKYRYFGHCQADKRVQQPVQFFDPQKRQERFENFDRAKANDDYLRPLKAPLDPVQHSYEETMARVRDLLDLSLTLNPFETKPKYPKHKYFGGGCNMTKRFERDASTGADELQQFQDHLRHQRLRSLSRPKTAPPGGRQPSEGTKSEPQLAPAAHSLSPDTIETHQVPATAQDVETSAASLQKKPRPKSASALSLRGRTPSACAEGIEQLTGQSSHLHPSDSLKQHQDLGQQSMTRKQRPGTAPPGGRRNPASTTAETEPPPSQLLSSTAPLHHAPGETPQHKPVQPRPKSASAASLRPPTPCGEHVERSSCKVNSFSATHSGASVQQLSPDTRKVQKPRPQSASAVTLRPPTPCADHVERPSLKVKSLSATHTGLGGTSLQQPSPDTAKAHGSPGKLQKRSSSAASGPARSSASPAAASSAKKSQKFVPLWQGGNQDRPTNPKLQDWPRRKPRSSIRPKVRPRRSLNAGFVPLSKDQSLYY